ncbi:MAG: hypothetical protein ACWIPJ_10020 [Polaribacter sp.]
MKNYLNRTDFTDIEKNEILHFLEEQVPINITDEMGFLNLNYYLIQKGFKPNMSKLKRLMSDYWNEHKTFQKKNIIPLIRTVKDGYREVMR